MKIREGFFPVQGLRLYFQARLLPSSAGLFIILHGHGEHLGRHEALAEFLLGMNYSVALYDSRGHGRSEGAEAHADSIREYEEDLSAFLAFLQSNFEIPKKIYLLGQSRGGLTAAGWALENPGKLSGLILTSPLFGLPLAPPLKVFNSILNGVFPKLCYPRPVHSYYLSHDAAVVQAYDRDPLVKRKISVRLVAEMLSYGEEIAEQKPLNFDCPLLVLAGGDDRIVSLEKTRRFFERAKASRKEIEIFEGFYHEIFLETGRGRAYEALAVRLRRLSAQT